MASGSLAVGRRTTRHGKGVMPRHRLSVVACLVALALGSAAACTPGADGGSAGAEPAAPELGVEHVHGLGVDPADGVLYAATHFGLWRMPEQGRATRVADRYQDTMGFTVVGPGTFLGSGHPDFRMDPDLPVRLGLIRSDDAGETWGVVSLGGRADFHVLLAAHGQVYGWDSGGGRVMVSGDGGETWETRSTLDLRDLVVSPGDPERLLATTVAGVLRSEDGGRTWTRVDGAPPLTVLAWAGQDSLYGVAADGTVHRSPDAGVTWSLRGAVAGEPEALTVSVDGQSERLYVAVAQQGILSSDDGGATFTVRYAE